MTYRERRLAKAERLREWANTRRQRAAPVFARSASYRGDHAFNTQPGHIPERARLFKAEDRAFASLAKADSMASRAAGIDAAADRAIYSDDPDAIEQLRARITALETKRDRIKIVNRAVRKHTLARLLQADPPFVLLQSERDELIQLVRLTPYHHPETKGFPAYALQNLSGNIGRQRKRLDDLEQRARVAEALAAER